MAKKIRLGDAPEIDEGPSSDENRLRILLDTVRSQPEVRRADGKKSVAFLAGEEVLRSYREVALLQESLLQAHQSLGSANSAVAAGFVREACLADEIRELRRPWWQKLILWFASRA